MMGFVSLRPIFNFIFNRHRSDCKNSIDIIRTDSIQCSSWSDLGYDITVSTTRDKCKGFIGPFILYIQKDKSS